ncbi:cadherin-related tumor suppressor-like [Condylostylus longicornis]|uniref:cadherin-related tumor suppressor-like n=1 Tax=Condylostylus longicornis TaxID=2530218 RepID=UPI00244E09FC|nr:cadherin-related tumor suppressor-like [Condylostylus longicornis]
MVLKLEIIWLFKFICFNQIIINAVHVPGPGPGFSNVSSSSTLLFSNNFSSQYGGIFQKRRNSDGDGTSQMQSRSVDTRVQLEVLEGLPRGTVVGFIPTKPGFTYRFNEPPREFVLDQNTGEIKTNIILDREDVQDRYDLVVLSSQPTYPIEVRITVLDINDNAPVFPEPSIAVSFSESAAPETRVLLDAATDRDIGKNSVTDDYRIVDGNHDEKFRLAVSTNPSGDVSYLQLETTGKLDRETQSFYQLNISARDGGDLYGYLQVNVTILDVNDNPPIFDHSDYVVSLNESVQPGTPVLQVMASDKDLGDNSKITYYLSDSEMQFTVDPETGVISTTQRLNCQNCQPYAKKEGSCTKSCVFTVFARDHGQPKQDGRTYVTVNLLDTNDHDPIIRFQYFPPTGNFATVDENAVNGSVVAAVSVEDRDEGLNGQTDIQIISGNELQHFRLENNPSFDIVRVNGVLDREEISKYNLTVVATDKGSPPRTSTAYLIIHVNDVNDHEPVFEKSEYSAILSELSPLGTYVASITATDEDTGVNAQIYYDFVSGNTKQWFLIDHYSGLITTQATLDREVQGTVVMNISAHDGGPNPKWAYSQLKVNILDENDEAPKFSQSQVNITLTENLPPQTVVAMLTATDHDQGTNGSVTYSLSPLVKQKYSDMFGIDMLTGQLITKAKLDREKNAFYEILVIAKDQGNPQQSSTATVYLNIGDINDNEPEFYPKHYFVSLPDDASNGKKLVKVTATDKDEGDNALITYSLENDADGLFAIDGISGEITLRKNFRNVQKSSYTLTVLAKDRGDRKAHKNAIVEVIKKSQMEILDFDSHLGYNFNIMEDDSNESPSIGREVGKVQIKPDSQIRLNSGFPSNSGLEYLITYGDPLENFEISKYGGVITTAKHIDREEISNYSVTVVARAGVIFAQTTVNISIGDLNDNAPIFTQDFEDIYLPENMAVGQEIHICKAIDRDSGVNSKITYSIIYNPNDQFKIGKTSGVMYLNRPLQSDPGTILHVELQATDSGKPNRLSKTTVMFTITDVNDHTPVFDHTSYETSLLEGTSVNTRFFALSASDADLGSNGKVDYFILEGNSEDKFGIFPDGYLYVKSELDREEKDYYSLTVICKDHGIPPRSSIVPLIIHVIDENDNAPKFSNSTFVYSIPENEPADSFVGKLTAHDNDIGRNAELTYFLASNELDFSIDSRNGFIKTLHTFDREELVKKNGHNYLEFEAVVSDNGNNRLIDKVKVKVFITDVNDNPPKFVRAPYKVQISEGSNVGSPVIHVFTIDLDEGLNGDVYYNIENGNQDGKFSLDSATGQISIASKLDRETKSIYKLIIVARDASLETQLSSSATVTIEVLDENDVAPEFLQTNTEIFVKETTAIGTELMHFKATDSDLGINSQVTFSISAGNRKDTFHIDNKSGSLYLHKTLDYEDTQSYSLNITASDGGNPKLSSTIIFTVHILDENDNPPSFPNTAIVRQIREGIPIKTPIVTINAEDPDSGLNGKVSYYISKQEPEDNLRHFEINSTTGVIYTLKKIDRETIDTFRLTVVAIDQAENIPKDLDSSTNGLVTYEMVNGNSELFKLNRNTGAITLQKTIDKPEIRYQLAIKATDEAVQNELLENEPPGTSILTVNARINSDDDAIEYYITNVTSFNGNKQVERLFEIDTKLGILSTANELDRECGIDTYIIEVYAVAIGDEPRIANTKTHKVLLSECTVKSSSFNEDGKENGGELLKVRVTEIFTTTRSIKK